MYNKRVLIGALSIAISISGCATTPTQEQTGMVIGGALGGLLGSQVGGGSGRTAAIIVGTLLGASVGGSVGRSMDETDQLKVANTLETVRTGVPAKWHNPDTGNKYTVTPIRTFDSTTGPCREYTVDANIGGKKETVIGTACRQADGTWKNES